MADESRGSEEGTEEGRRRPRRFGLAGAAVTAPIPAPKPSRFLRWMFAIPVWLYRHGLGWMLGHRFLLLSHRGRKTGRVRQTVLEVILYNAAARESVVVSAYGTGADWYRNLEKEPALRVQTGRLDYRPSHRLLTGEEAWMAARTFVRQHPLEARLASLVLRWIGATGDEAPKSAVELIASLPLVGFRPRSPTTPNP